MENEEPNRTDTTFVKEMQNNANARNANPI